MKKRVTIIGAGVAGLATAWKLLRSSNEYEITIIERDAVPGGLARTVEWNGYLLDLGPHRFHTEIPEIREFIRTFCEEEMEWVNRFSRMYLNGRYIPYPIKPLPTFSALGLKKSLAFFFSALGVAVKSRSAHARSYEEYVSNYYGVALYKAIFEPFARKVWGIDPSQLEGEVAQVRLRGNNIWHALLDGLFSKQETYVSSFLYPPQGIGEIPKKFAGEIIAQGGTILYNHSLESVQIQDNRITAITCADGNQSLMLDCDIFISTIPLPLLTQKIANIPTHIADAASKLHYRALALLYLIFDRDVGVNDTWLYFPEEEIPFSRISVPENFTRLNKSPGKSCFCLEYPCEVGDELWKTPPETLAKEAGAVLKRSGLVDAAVSDFFAIHLSDGYPLYRTGYAKNLNTVLSWLQSLENAISTGRQGLFRHNNTDQSIQMGLDTATHLLEHPKNLPAWYENVDRYNDYRIVD